MERNRRIIITRIIYSESYFATIRKSTQHDAAPGHFIDGHIFDGHIFDGHIFDGHIFDQYIKRTYFRQDIFSTGHFFDSQVKSFLLVFLAWLDFFGLA